MAVTYCQKKVQNTGLGVRTEKRGELCAIVEPQSSMLVISERFLITFESGAESLLINKLVAKRIHSVISLTL